MIEVRLSVVITASNDDKADRVLSAIASRAEFHGVQMSMVETSRKLVSDE